MIYLGQNDLTPYALVVFILSILGSLFIILSYWKFVELRDQLLKCVLFISISDLIYTVVFFICFFLPLSQDGVMDFPCYFEAIFLEQFIIASWFWPACFALQLYLHIVRGIKVERFRYFHLVSWGIPLLCNIVLLSTNSFSLPNSTTGWCWIDTDKVAFVFVFGYGILGLLLILETVLYLTIINHIRRQLSSFSLFPGATVSNQIESRVGRLTFYLLVPLLCWSWGLAARIYEVTHAGSTDPHYLNTTKWLTEVQICFAASQGFWNALIYLFNSKLRVRWLETLRGRKAGYEPISAMKREDWRATQVRGSQDIGVPLPSIPRDSINM